MNTRAFFYLLLFFSPLSSHAQGQQSLWFHHLGKEDGLLNTTINSIFQDSEGFTWIGTESGLNRYDGYTLASYLPDASDPRALSGGRITGGFFEDSEKNIWFCTDVSIQCYVRQYDYFESYQVRDNRKLEIKSGYKAIYLESDSLLWLEADSRNIYWFNIHTHQYADTAVAKTIFDIDVFPGVKEDGRMEYLFSVDGSKSPGLEVFKLDPSKNAIHSFVKFRGDDPNLPALNIHSVCFEQNTAVWLSANSGIYRWNMSSGAGELQQFPTNNFQAKRIAPGDDNHFWVTESRTGLSIIDKSRGELESINGRLVNDPTFGINHLMYDLYNDPMGNIWIRAFEEGLIYVHPDKTKFRSIPKFPGINGATNYSFRTMIQGADHQIWCSTFTNGIFLLDKNGNLLRHYHPGHSQYNSIPSAQINHMLLDRNQRLWAATEKGVSYFEPASESFIPITDEKGGNVDYIVYLFELRNGDIIASSLQRGIFKIVEKENTWRLQQIYAPDGETDFFTTIYEDRQGSIYISRKLSEVIIFDYSKGSLKPVTSLPINGYINGFHEDEDEKILWIATSSGLVKLEKTDIKKPPYTFTNREGLQSNEIQSLILGKDQNLWMGTSGGISRFNRDSSQFVNFSLADGLQSRQFNNLAVLGHEDGALWFGGDNGITIVDPARVKFLETKPKIQITEILVNDQVFDNLFDANTQSTNPSTIHNLVRSFRENTLSFSFVAIDYSDPAGTQLEYQMEKVDKSWVRLKKGEPGFARYANLSPNTYTFRIRAANSDGLWSSEEKVLSITITPPWYQTWWARSLFALLFALALYALYRYRINQIRKAEAFKRKEAEYKQLVAENETAVLRLQMNPHFIFNSMNSISSYILQKDIDTANDYLNRFAKLMRMILKFAEKPFLSVSQELELLEQYLNTEAMRFEDKIDYEFKVADDLDPDEVILPTMILQPFIENAIWHGLATKEGAKKISIGFEQEAGQLICSVQDNGIGRAAAQGKAPSHESKAISITRRRLSILEEMEGASTSLEIIDLKDEAGSPAGTRVVICLPLL
ncbi:MAG: histidine kinase [Phaeodactylibacter sp.]|nr:histidine kinase [Phaeodactylibacter sp.]